MGAGPLSRQRTPKFPAVREKIDFASQKVPSTIINLSISNHLQDLRQSGHPPRQENWQGNRPESSPATLEPHHHAPTLWHRAGDQPSGWRTHRLGST